MADELSFTYSADFESTGGISVSFPETTFTVDVSGTDYKHAVQDCTTSGGTISDGDINAEGYFFCVHRGASTDSDIHLHVASGSDIVVCKAGELNFFRVGAGVVRATYQGSSGTAPLEYWYFEA